MSTRYRLAFLDRSESRVQNMDIEANSFQAVMEVVERVDGFTTVDIATKDSHLARLVRAGPEGSKLWQLVPAGPTGAISSCG